MANLDIIKQVHAMGMRICRTEAGEWRINLPNGTEATAYYTEDDEDAVNTARAMQQARDQIGRIRFSSAGATRRQ